MRIFSNIEWFKFEAQRFASIKDEIEGFDKRYILGVDENECKGYLYDKYKLDPIAIDIKSQHFDEPERKSKSSHDFFGKIVNLPYYCFEIFYNVSGSFELIYVQPTQFFLNNLEITPYSEESKISFSFDLEKLNAEIFQKKIQDRIPHLTKNQDNINKDVKLWNTRYKGLIDMKFKDRKDSFLKENDFFKSIKLKVNKNSESVFSAQSVKKKKIPQPKIDKTEEFSSVPTLAMSVYKDIIEVIYDIGKILEKKPSLYFEQGEEDLRDYLLSFLETRYESTSASAEAFNRKGKTDILLKHNDRDNIFIAECKIWRGKKSFYDAIEQLFDRYLTWRDTKTALIVFVKQKGMTNILQTIQSSIKNHKYYSKFLSQRKETSFSYEMKLPQDEDQTVLLEIIVFHLN